jgi:hypothetical protein
LVYRKHQTRLPEVCAFDEAVVAVLGLAADFSPGTVSGVRTICFRVLLFRAPRTVVSPVTLRLRLRRPV